jgi:hypothetical protein
LVKNTVPIEYSTFLPCSQGFYEKKPKNAKNAFKQGIHMFTFIIKIGANPNKCSPFVQKGGSKVLKKRKNVA